MISELFIAFQIAAASADVALVEDVVSYREPVGEYIFYVAADREFGVDSANPKKVDGNNYALSFEVSVSFEDDAKQVAVSEIADYSNASGDNFALIESMVNGKAPEAVKQLYASSGLTGVILPVESGDGWASWAEFSWVRADEITMSFVLKQVEGDRVKVIQAISRSESYKVSQVYDHWKSLVTSYQVIPEQRFYGAKSL